MELFGAVLPEAATSAHFRALRDARGYAAARALMERVFRDYLGPRVEFAKDFQGRGFSARTWELALLAWLLERDLPVKVGRGAPDFVVETAVGQVAIEATTTNPAEGSEETPAEALSRIERAMNAGHSFLAPERVVEEQQWFILQLAKVLRRKLLKQDAEGRPYWEDDAIAGKPFVIAVMAHHSGTALHYSINGLTEYLFGLAHRPMRDTEGRLEVIPEPVGEHAYGGKAIPSGLFAQVEAAHLSAVIFSNAGTVAQFQRIGMEQGFGTADVRAIRAGWAWDPDPNAAVPRGFRYEVKAGEIRENFAQGLHVIHNPWCKYRLLPGQLPDAVELTLRDDGLVVAEGPDFQPFTSETVILTVSE